MREVGSLYLSWSGGKQKEWIVKRDVVNWRDLGKE